MGVVRVERTALASVRGALRARADGVGELGVLDELGAAAERTGVLVGAVDGVSVDVESAWGVGAAAVSVTVVGEAEVHRLPVAVGEDPRVRALVEEVGAEEAMRQLDAAAVAFGGAGVLRRAVPVSRGADWSVSLDGVRLSGVPAGLRDRFGGSDSPEGWTGPAVAADVYAAVFFLAGPAGPGVVWDVEAAVSGGTATVGVRSAVAVSKLGAVA